MQITITVNGKEHSADVEPMVSLASYLRENLRLTGTHIGCDTSSCGSCTVTMDGNAVKSCTVAKIPTCELLSLLDADWSGRSGLLLAAEPLSQSYQCQRVELAVVQQSLTYRIALRGGHIA